MPVHMMKNMLSSDVQGIRSDEQVSDLWTVHCPTAGHLIDNELAVTVYVQTVHTLIVRPVKEVQ